MGKIHRAKRKMIKAMLPHGWHENEFGELVKTISKAEARQLLLQKYLASKEFYKYAENQIMKLAQQRAIDEIMAIEDARILNEICSPLS